MMFRRPYAIKPELLGKDDLFHQLAIGRCRHRLTSRRATIYPKREAQRVVCILSCHLFRLTLSANSTILLAGNLFGAACPPGEVWEKQPIEWLRFPSIFPICLVSL